MYCPPHKIQTVRLPHGNQCKHVGEHHTFILKEEYMYQRNLRHVHSFTVADFRISASLRVATFRTRARHCGQNNIRNQDQHHGLCCRQPRVRGTRDWPLASNSTMSAWIWTPSRRLGLRALVGRGRLVRLCTSRQSRRSIAARVFG